MTNNNDRYAPVADGLAGPTPDEPPKPGRNVALTVLAIVIVLAGAVGAGVFLSKRQSGPTSPTPSASTGRS